MAVLLSSCSRHESEAPAEPSASAPVARLPDLALAETWDRAVTITPVRGRAEIIVAPVAIEFDRRCEPREDCLCVGQVEVKLQGPREKDRRELAFGERNTFRCNECNGECPFPVGQVEVEGTLSETTFALTKPPKYLDGRKPEPAIAEELVRGRRAVPRQPAR